MSTHEIILVGAAIKFALDLVRKAFPKVDAGGVHWAAVLIAALVEGAKTALAGGFDYQWVKTASEVGGMVLAAIGTNEIVKKATSK